MFVKHAFSDKVDDSGNLSSQTVRPFVIAFDIGNKCLQTSKHRTHLHSSVS